MRRALLIVIAALLVSPLASAAGPKIWLVRDHPIKVAGKGFAPLEHVRILVASAKERYVLGATSSAAGAIVAQSTASFRANCGSLVVTAIGAQGDRAVYKVPANDCDPIPGR